MHFQFGKKFLLALLSVILSISACAKVFVVADHPFVVAEAPADLPKLPLSVAIVRSPAMDKIRTHLGNRDDFDHRLAKAAMSGMLDAARLVVMKADLIDVAPTQGYDLVCIPSNPYFDVQRDPEYRYIVTMSLEVTVVETKTKNKRGLLLEATGVPGKRPAVPVSIVSSDGETEQVAGVTGALIYGGYFEQAVNNTMFYLALDFATKLQKRGMKILHEEGIRYNY